MVKRILITGGAGFIGSNAVVHYARQNWEVIVLDNLSRKGSSENLEWLRNQVAFCFEQVDIRDTGGVLRVVAKNSPDVLLHLAAQVAVTTSVANPREDFEVNAMGTLNLLEAIRIHSPKTFFLFASTNKVYGDLPDLGIEEKKRRWVFKKLPLGVNEGQTLVFQSPYGCSKGCADQYVLDYNKSFGLMTTAMRQSCIYGPRQFGIEDQGWVAWFIIAAVTGRLLTIYGDGKQTRDVLHVADLLVAYDAAISKRERVAGQAFNIGGGPDNILSLLDLLEKLEEIFGQPVPRRWASWRVGDQRTFVCDISKARTVLQWEPKIGWEQGIRQLFEWVKTNQHLFQVVTEAKMKTSVL